MEAYSVCAMAELARYQYFRVMFLFDHRFEGH
jgi:hypothetical protein